MTDFNSYETVLTGENLDDESRNVVDRQRRKKKIKNLRRPLEKKKGVKHYSQYISVSGTVSLSSDLRDMFLSEEDSDVTILVGEQEYRAHVNILRSRSHVFAAMLKHDMLERNNRRVDIPDCHPHVFREFLLYLYTGRVDDISHGNVFELFQVCDKYDVKGLKNDCVRFLRQNLSLDLICDVLVLAMKHIESDLLKCATQFFVENADDILPSAEWQSFVKANPVQANELFIKAYKENTRQRTTLNQEEVPGSSSEQENTVEHPAGEIHIEIPEGLGQQSQQARHQIRELLQNAGMSPGELQNVLETIRDVLRVLPNSSGEHRSIREQVREILAEAEE